MTKDILSLCNSELSERRNSKVRKFDGGGGGEEGVCNLPDYTFNFQSRSTLLPSKSLVVGWGGGGLFDYSVNPGPPL